MTTATTDPSALQAQAREHAAAMPLQDIDPANPSLFENDTVGHYFERLRRDAPVHRSTSPLFGPYWSVTTYREIMAVDTNHQVYSSDWSRGGIVIGDRPLTERLQMFIAMDPPKHDVQRLAVSPIVAPANLANMERLIRERTCRVLDELPRGETFDWVERVSIELTTLMLATLFDFPLEDRRLLTHWSDCATANPDVDRRVVARWPRTSRGCGTSGSTRRRGPTWCRCSPTVPRRGTCRPSSTWATWCC
jgi:cytochrome P450